MASLNDRKRRAWLHASINQLAFPGLGTILAGRKIGWIQAVTMVTGFLLTIGFMAWYLTCAFRYLQGTLSTEEQFHHQYEPYAWVLKSGIALCLVAWFWSLVSSLSLLSEASANAVAHPPPFPSSSSPEGDNMGHGQIDRRPD